VIRLTSVARAMPQDRDTTAASDISPSRCGGVASCPALRRGAGLRGIR
jgi:hypothetical protein